ncbi:MAG: hypothetical protein ABI478_02620, partial [Propionivibrio sp.]
APALGGAGTMGIDPAVKARQEAHATDKEALKKGLVTGKDKAYYRQQLEKMGYAITAVNSDKDDYLEYEVVKDGNSWEVQVDFDKGVADKVEIDNNVWKADSTKAALKAQDYKYVYPAGVTANPELVSDRVRGKAWNDEKAKIEKDLGVGHDRAYYQPALEKMGYKVTSVNDNEADYLEYEVVKGDTSYEVKVDFDEKTKMSTDVNIDNNWWETDATEKVKGEK